MRNKFSELNEDEKDMLKVWFDENAEIFDLITEGAKKPYYWKEYGTKDGNEPGVMMAIWMPHLGLYRDVGRALCKRSRFNAEKELFTDVFDDLKTCYILSNHQKKQHVAYRGPGCDCN